MDQFQLLGEIRLFPYFYAIRDWAPCDGRLLDIASNAPLFSLLGTQFGGDGQKTFALPNLKDKQPAEHLTYCIAVAGNYPSRD